jgi:hypothetical protein
VLAGELVGRLLAHFGRGPDGSEAVVRVGRAEESECLADSTNSKVACVPEDHTRFQTGRYVLQDFTWFSSSPTDPVVVDADLDFSRRLHVAEKRVWCWWDGRKELLFFEGSGDRPVGGYAPQTMASVADEVGKLGVSIGQE